MNGSAADTLSRYYEGTLRTASELQKRDGIRGQVDSLLEDLRIPCSIDPEGDWVIENDAGRFTLFVREGDQRVVLRQKVMTLTGDFVDYADDLELLMELNIRGEGACFASQPFSEGYMVVITGQVPWDGIDAEKLGNLLDAAFRLSTDLDEALGDETLGGEAHGDGDEESDSDTPLEMPEPEPEPDHLGVAPQANSNGNGAWPANWYHDPRGEARLRYWDGSTWTDYTAA